MLSWCDPNVQELRVEHFGRVEVRQLVRDVALMVQERIRTEAFVPTGSTTKALDTLKLKILVLQLPERDASMPVPIQRLLDIKYDSPFVAAKLGSNAKKHKARAVECTSSIAAS